MSGNYFMGFEPVQDDFYHGFTRMNDEADGSKVLADIQVTLSRKCNNQRLSPTWGRTFSCSPDFVANICQNIYHCLPACITSSAGTLSTPADLPFFSAATAISVSSRRIGSRDLRWIGTTGTYKNYKTILVTSAVDQDGRLLLYKFSVDQELPMNNIHVDVDRADTAVD
ncbi:MAG: hypothetical protein AB2693_27645 [Candidatus Thiodiazotropha sp.]